MDIYLVKSRNRQRPVGLVYADHWKLIPEIVDYITDPCKYLFAEIESEGAVFFDQVAQWPFQRSEPWETWELGRHLEWFEFTNFAFGHPTFNTRRFIKEEG